MVGFDDLRSLFKPIILCSYDSMILFSTRIHPLLLQIIHGLLVTTKLVNCLKQGLNYFKINFSEETM